jgi:hypothetical protein
MFLQSLHTSIFMLACLCVSLAIAGASPIGVDFVGTFNSWTDGVDVGVYQALASDCSITKINAEVASYNEHYHSDIILIDSNPMVKPEFKVKVTSGYSDLTILDCSTCAGFGLDCAMSNENGGWYPSTEGNVDLSAARGEQVILHFWPFGRQGDTDDQNDANDVCADSHCPLLTYEIVPATASPTKAVPSETAPPTKAPTVSPTSFPTTSPTTSPTNPPVTTFSPTTSPTTSPTLPPYIPPELNGPEEVEIEGLGEDDFPDDLSELFRLQHMVFVLLYGLLALRIVVQIVVSDGIKKSMKGLNRHYIALFVFLGCLVRIAYITTTDLHSALLSMATLEYFMRAFNDVLWFCAFNYLVFFWYEVQVGMRRNLVNVDATRHKMYAVMAVFSLLRFSRATCEAFTLKIGVFATKGASAMFLICFFAFAQYWGRGLLSRLRSMSAKVAVARETTRAISRNPTSSTDSARTTGTTGTAATAATGVSRTTTTKAGMGAAVASFRTFLILEAALALVALLEHAASTVLKEEGLISLEKNPDVVFALKVVQRGTEFAMMAVLTQMVCIKTSSKDFKLPVLPSLAIPLFCSEAGWFTSRRYTEEDDDTILLIENMHRNTVRRIQSQQDTLDSLDAGLPRGWRAYMDDDGSFYYVHDETGNVSTARPTREEEATLEMRELVQENRELKKAAVRASTINDAKVHKISQGKRKKSVAFKVAGPGRRTSANGDAMLRAPDDSNVARGAVL